MEKDDSYSAPLPSSFNGMDYPLDYQHMMKNQPQQQQQQVSFADVMQFADFGPKLALNQTKISEDETGIDPVYFLKFPVLNQSSEDCYNAGMEGGREEEATRASASASANDNNNNSCPLGLLEEDYHQTNYPLPDAKNKRKRPRSVKTNEEVESQRMTHIAVERNRRKQMNEHLRVLRSLMPGSYVQRGDQASIIGGAIEFVRELEQLLQCLESQKRRRLMEDSSSIAIQQQQQPPFFPPMLPLPNEVDLVTGLQEEIAENKSCFADIEVKLLGFDAIIKILSRRRPGQLIKTIAALEEMQLNILHTNITTIEQTVLYSLNVKVESESRFTAQDIANAVQQIFSFIHSNSSI